MSVTINKPGFVVVDVDVYHNTAVVQMSRTVLREFSEFLNRPEITVSCLIQEAVNKATGELSNVYDEAIRGLNVQLEKTKSQLAASRSLLAELQAAVARQNVELCPLPPDPTAALAAGWRDVTEELKKLRQMKLDMEAAASCLYGGCYGPHTALLAAKQDLETLRRITIALHMWSEGRAGTENTLASLFREVSPLNEKGN